MTVTESDSHGLVTVTVDSSGVLRDLRLGARIRDRPVPEIRQLILDVMRAALATLADRVTEAVDETVGSDTEVGRAIADTYTRRLAPPEDEGGHEWHR